MLAAWDLQPVTQLVSAEDRYPLSVLAWSATRQGFAGPMYRGLWAAARAGKHILSDLKRAQEQTETDLMMWTVYGSLAGIGLRHRKLRAEVSGAMWSPYASESESRFEGAQLKYITSLANLFIAAFRAQLEDPEAAVLQAQRFAQHVVFESLVEEGNTRFSSAEDVPLDVAAQLIRWNPTPLVRVEPSLQVSLIEVIPWAVTMDVEDFFLPRTICRQRPFPWRPEHTLDVLKAHRNYAPRVPTRSERVKPNAPCPCGSGKKYKKCCGRSWGNAPKVDSM